MAFQLNDFRNKFADGGARPSQFEMQLVWPDALRGLPDVSGAERDFRFFCETSEIPASTIGTVAVKYFGRTLNFAGDRTFGTLSLTVLNDTNFRVRRALESWSASIASHSSSLSAFGGGIQSGSFVTDGVVTQYGRSNGGAALAAYKFVGMFPTSIAAIPLDWNSNDQFEKFNVEFTYQWWEPVDVQSGISIGVSINL